MFRRSSLSLLASLLLSALVAAPCLAADKKVVHVGVVERPDLAPFILALHGGLFEKQGLDVQPVVGTSGQDFVASLATGQMEVASGVPNAGLYNALNRGIDIRLVADYAHVSQKPEDSTVSIVVRADLVDSGKVKGPADLKGLTIAAGPSNGQYPQILLSKALAQGHLTLADVNVRFLPFPEAIAAMGSKTLDGGFMIEPLTTQADARNVARRLIPAGAVDPGAELSIVLYSAQFAADRDAATRYMIGFLGGVRMYYDAFFLKKGRDEAIAILTQFSPLKEAKLWAEAIPQNTDLNGRIDIENLRQQAVFFKEQGTLTGNIPDFGRVVDMSFADAALKVLGARDR
jgi:NitT/TauT family transport system substrate-binding protein